MNKRHGNRWTQTTILAAIIDHTLTTGKRPTAEEWQQPGPWPNYKTVRRHFGTWANAIQAAGFTNVKQGHHITNRHRKRGPYKTPDKSGEKEK